ncbi:MAG: hypothetical protein ABUK01_16250 [Leptospirales bacterium]
MAGKIILTHRAQAQRLQILDYWYKHNGNKIYSNKLDFGFRRIFRLLKD